jgi:hypothetical protein
MPKMVDVPKIEGYKELKPGKREIVVPKPKGYFFDSQSFNNVLYRDAVINHYLKYYEGRVMKFNDTVDRLEAERKKLTQMKPWYKRLFGAK